MIKKRTFVDAGVLIAAARGDYVPSMIALKILDDQSREFASSPFIELEVLPKAVYNGKKDEVEFYEAFFDSVSFWEDDLAGIVKAGNTLHAHLVLPQWIHYMWRLPSCLDLRSWSQLRGQVNRSTGSKEYVLHLSIEIYNL